MRPLMRKVNITLLIFQPSPKWATTRLNKQPCHQSWSSVVTQQVSLHFNLILGRQKLSSNVGSNLFYTLQITTGPNAESDIIFCCNLIGASNLPGAIWLIRATYPAHVTSASNIHYVIWLVRAEYLRSLIGASSTPGAIWLVRVTCPAQSNRY